MLGDKFEDAIIDGLNMDKLCNDIVKSKEPNNINGETVIVESDEDLEKSKKYVASMLDVQVKKDRNIDFQTRKIKTQSKDLIKNVNNQFLIDILSPEIVKNEESKRFHKAILLTLLSAFILIQFGSVIYFTNRVTLYAVGKSASAEMVKILFTFLSAYITSVVVELIAILRYIVKNVFDTSIAELVKMFKEENC